MQIENANCIKFYPKLVYVHIIIFLKVKNNFLDENKTQINQNGQ